MSERRNLSPFGWLLAFVMYCVQASVLMKFLVEHTGNKWYWCGLAFYILLAIGVIVVACDLSACARKDEAVSKVWNISIACILIFVISVAFIFFKVAKKLEQADGLSYA